MMHVGTGLGTYALLLQTRKTGEIVVGRLGLLTLQPGYYVYVGSALGAGGLRARINRHARQEKRCRWHVDYLRAVTELVDVWYTCDSRRRECPWSATLDDMAGSEVPVVGFGSSDCRCTSHLYRFDGKPSVAVFRRRLTQQFTDHGPVRRVEMSPVRAS